MSLAELQTALGTLVVTRAAGHLVTGVPQGRRGESGLTAGEQAWLHQLHGSAGFEVTCFIQRWWRQTRLRWAAPLTWTILGPATAEEVAGHYFRVVPAFSLFFTPEAMRFLDFVIGLNLRRPHVDAVARFERALLQAEEEAAFANAGETDASASHRPVSRDHGTETVVEFRAPPEEVLGALLFQTALPEPGGTTYPVLISSRLSQRWQPLAGRP